VRFVVGYPAGGATDILARLIGQKLSERTGQQFVIENKPGAGNNIGTESVVRATPDGYTVLLVNPANAINATPQRVSSAVGLVLRSRKASPPRSMYAMTARDANACSQSHQVTRWRKRLESGNSR